MRYMKYHRVFTLPRARADNPTTVLISVSPPALHAWRLKVRTTRDTRYGACNKHLCTVLVRPNTNIPWQQTYLDGM